MRLPRIQLTIRRIMIAVAVVGVAFSMPAALRRRSESFSRISQAHFRVANAQYFLPLGSPMRVSLACWRWHVQLGRRYQSAATRPWLPVESDPPKPE